jgi:hypothetical protein
MNWEIRKIDLWSAIKISFIANAALGFVLGLVIGLMSAVLTKFMYPFMAMRGEELEEIGTASGAFMVIFMPFFMAFFMAVIYGVVITGIVVLIYNIIAGLAGGIRITLAQPDLAVQGSTPTSPAKSVPPSSYE